MTNWLTRVTFVWFNQSMKNTIHFEIPCRIKMYENCKEYFNTVICETSCFLCNQRCSLVKFGLAAHNK